MSEANPALASALVATLERAWAAIVAEHPAVPEVVVVVAPGSGGRARELKLGHFAAARWEVDGGQRSELLVGGEGLRLGAEEVLGTLLHEGAHGLGWARGVQDTSRGGRYHNRRYKVLAEEMGLDVSQVGSIGWSGTKVRPETIERYRATLADIEASLVLWRRVEAGSGRGTAGGRNLLACQCPCGRRIRVARATLDQGAVSCGLCQGCFAPAGDGAEAVEGE